MTKLFNIPAASFFTKIKMIKLRVKCNGCKVDKSYIQFLSFGKLIILNAELRHEYLRPLNNVLNS